VLRRDVTLRIGSESESVSSNSRTRDDIQGVTLCPRRDTRRVGRSIALLAILLSVKEYADNRMHYNELKVRVLDLFKTDAEMDSFKIRELLHLDSELKLTDKAVEMALMRYSRQGLLSRIRRGSRFQYSLTDRGLARREWLVKNR